MYIFDFDFSCRRANAASRVRSVAWLTNAVEERLLLALSGAAVTVHGVHVVALLTLWAEIAKGGGTQETPATTASGEKTRNIDDTVLPLDATIATVGSSQLVDQRRGGLALTVAGDSLDLVGVGNMRHHVPAYKKWNEIILKMGRYKNIKYNNKKNGSDAKIGRIVPLLDQLTMTKEHYGMAVSPEPGLGLYWDRSK